MGPRNSKVTIITAYRPVRGAVGGLLTVANQHRKVLGQSVVPRKQMLSDLQEFITPLLQEGHHIILGVNANKTIPLVYSIIMKGFEKFYIDVGLVDALATIQGHCPIRSCSKSSSSSPPIDFILCSPKLIPFLRVGMMDWLEGGPSDHNAFGIDIDIGQLWRKIPRNSLRRSSQEFTVDNKRRTTKFTQAASELVNKAR